MRYVCVIFFLSLSACDFFKSPSPTASYELHSREVGEHEYEIIIEAKPDIAIEQLKHEFKAHGETLCQERVYLLRGMREDMLPAENRVVLRGLVDCVSLDYFHG